MSNRCRHCGEEEIYYIGDSEDNLLILKRKRREEDGEVYWELRITDGSYETTAIPFWEHELIDAFNILSKIIEPLRKKAHEDTK